MIAHIWSVLHRLGNYSILKVRSCIAAMCVFTPSISLKVTAENSVLKVETKCRKSVTVLLKCSIGSRKSVGRQKLEIKVGNNCVVTNNCRFAYCRQKTIAFITSMQMFDHPWKSEK